MSPDDVRALSELEAPLDVAADEAVAAEEVRRAAAEHRAEGAPGFGCSFGTHAVSGRRAWLALLFASLLAARASRRR